MQHICPSCKSANTHVLDFEITEYICANCRSVISVDEKIKVLKSRIDAELKIGDRGILDEIEWYVIAIVHRKYGSFTKWREYYLKSRDGKNGFLSESDGNFVLMYPTETTIENFSGTTEFEGKIYRRYEVTQCSIESAEGFFEEKLFFGVAEYMEFVNGTNMVSHERHGTRRENFYGKHIKRSAVKKAFNQPYLPEKTSIGIVQPFFINVKQLLNIFSAAAILMGIVYFANFFSRENQEVLNETLAYTDMYNREFVSKSFELKGAAAPMVVDLYSNVDNSWANAEISLVNEITNEIQYTSQDIEMYSGMSEGERWSEGSTSKSINLCGIPAGKYHFEIAAQKERMENPSTKVYISADNTLKFKEESSGWIVVIDNKSETERHFLREGFAKVEPLLYQKFVEAKSRNSEISAGPDKVSDPTPFNSEIKIKATWKPVTMWNIGFILIIMAILTLAAYIFKYSFEYSKWSNSSNSPYT